MKMQKLTAAASVALLLGAGLASAQVEMTYAHSENPSSTVAAEAFKKIVEGRSGGDIEVNLVIHGALGSDRDVVDQLSLGELDMYVVGVHGLSAIAPNFQFFDAPYLFTNRREFYALMEDKEFVTYVNDYLATASNGTILYKGAAENSVRNLYTKAGPIRTPDGLNVVKLRVSPGPLNIAMWEALGVGSVVGLSGSERNQALQSGIIDGVEGSLSGAMGNGHLDVLDHVQLTGHSYSYMAYLLNTAFYDSLTPEQQMVLDEAIDLSITIQNGAAITLEHAALEQAAAEGNTVTVLTDAELNAWKGIAYPVGQDFIASELDADFVQTASDALANVRAGFEK